jgi:hypothetical protein
MLCDNLPLAPVFVIVCKSPVRDDCKLYAVRPLGSAMEEGVFEDEVEAATLMSLLSPALNHGT